MSTTPFNASAYTNTTFAARAEIIVNNLTRIARFIKQVNSLERSQVNRSDCKMMFGLDDTVNGTIDFPRHASGTAGSANARPTVFAKFYQTVAQAATRFYGLSSDDLTSADGYLPEMSATYRFADYDSYLSILKDQLGVSELNLDFWRLTRFTSAGIVGASDSVFFRSSVLNSTSVPTSIRELRVCDFIYAITAAVARAKLWLRIYELLPASRGGRDGALLEQASYSTYWQQTFSLIPAEICQIRQTLTRARLSSEYTQYTNFLEEHWRTDAIYDDEHDGYGPGDGVCDICDDNDTSYEHIVENELEKIGMYRTDYYWLPQATEIPDKTRDITVYTPNATIEDDPLYIVKVGSMPMYDSSGNIRLTLGATLMRKYAARRAMVAWDYQEAANPNAFEAYGGKANYRLSNIRNWLNSTNTGISGWKVPTHTYDDFWTGGQEGYLSAISDTLRANIAKTVLPYNEQYAATEMADKAQNQSICEDWAFIPDIYDYNTQAKGWTNFLMGTWTELDADLFASDDPMLSSRDALANDCLWLNDGAYTDDGVKRKYINQGINPNFKGDTKDYASSGLYLATRNIMSATADTRDATIANRVACYVSRAPFDGTGSNSNGATVPSNYNPTHYCVAVVGFHADQLDCVPKAKCNGPTLS